MIEEAETIPGRVPVGEWPAVKLGLSEPALIPGDDPELAPQRLHLRRKHLPVHQEPVREDDRRPVPFGVVVAESLTVYLGEWHLTSILWGSASPAGSGATLSRPRGSLGS